MRYQNRLPRAIRVWFYMIDGDGSWLTLIIIAVFVVGLLIALIKHQTDARPQNCQDHSDTLDLRQK